MNILMLCFSILFSISCSGDKPKTEKKDRTEVKSEFKSTESVSASETKAEPKAKEEKETQDTPGATPEQIAKAKEIIKAVSAKDIDAVDAKKKFKMACASCHGFKGNLNINGAKDLTLTEVSLEDAVAQVYFGKGLMTPFKGILSDAEIVAVSKYIETLRK